jgi:hypothetical protein
MLPLSSSCTRSVGRSGPGLLRPYVDVAAAKTWTRRVTWRVYDVISPEPQPLMVTKEPVWGAAGDPVGGGVAPVEQVGVRRLADDVVGQPAGPVVGRDQLALAPRGAGTGADRVPAVHLVGVDGVEGGPGHGGAAGEQGADHGAPTSGGSRPRC